MAFVGTVWAFFTLFLLKKREFDLVKSGANIQEQFDVGLFHLPWNRILVGEKLTLELVKDAASHFSGEKEKLKNWYADTGDAPYPLDVLLCQRANLVWDWRLRINYSKIIAFITVVFLITTIVFAFYTNQTLINYILGILVPSSAAIIQGSEVSKTHYEIGKEKQDKERVISDIFEEARFELKSVDIILCRSIQDFIYTTRVNSPLIPDWYYNLYQKQFERDMRAAVADLTSANDGF
jgi:hypothetical protein